MRAATRRLEEIVDMNLTNVEKAQKLYAPYLHLLKEDERIRGFTAVLSHTRENYLEQVNRLTAVEDEIRKTCPQQVRLQMVVVDCHEINETLCAQAVQGRDVLLQSIVDRNRDRNHRLVKSFENVANRIQKKPTSERELVELEDAVENFRRVELRQFSDEFTDLLAWQDLLFSCEKLLTKTVP